MVLVTGKLVGTSYVNGVVVIVMFDGMLIVLLFGDGLGSSVEFCCVCRLI